MSGDLRSTAVPTAFEVRELFEGMLGREVEWDGNAKRVDPLDGATVATYVDDLGNVLALALADVPLTARAGAAIGLLPQAIAEQAVESSLVTPVQYENAVEILNVAASLLNKPDSPHLRLREAFSPRETLPAEVSELALQQANRLDGALTIQGYGSGRISIVVRF
ncbi:MULTISPECIES: hypothetical protein [Demequina]|uniref:Uncharacterized protein n=1 Tax=Demequina litorisediminis TaxID=1849022 RepID=A0ABQ6ICQ4_9MICO|nr:hypothetical protein [Demequina litorisediminis]GMA35622.1 hypothetical protein GCM10025876_18260 [Demequina litorisediminis]